MITSTRRVSPDKSEVRIAFSLDNTPGKHSTHNESSLHNRLSYLFCVYLHLLASCSCITNVRSSTFTSFPVCVEHMHSILPTKTDPPPPHSHTLYPFNCVHSSTETGAPSLSVGPQNIKTLCTWAAVHMWSVIYSLIQTCTLHFVCHTLWTVHPMPVCNNVSLQWGQALGQQLQLRSGGVRFPL